MQRFKSAILPELKNCQNGTFEPVHCSAWNSKIFLTERLVLKRYEDEIYKEYP